MFEVHIPAREVSFCETPVYRSSKEVRGGYEAVSIRHDTVIASDRTPEKIIARRLKGLNNYDY
jgi:hypothetical protein